MVAGNAGKAGKLAAGTFWLPLLFAVAIHTAKKREGNRGYQAAQCTVKNICLIL